MVTLNDILEERSEILRIAAKHGAHEVRIFGSIVRGQAKDESDLDFLVRMDEDRSLLDHIALMHELEDFLGRKVDVVTEEALHRTIRNDVLLEAVEI